MKQKIILLAALAGLASATGAQAQQFTTAAEVRPILDATRSNWIAVREYDGRDLLYFTHLLAWRCGLEGIYYRVNDGPEQRWNAEPCHEGEAQPNAMTSADHLPFIGFPLGSIQTVEVRLVYDDGGESTARFERDQVMIP